MTRASSYIAMLIRKIPESPSLVVSDEEGNLMDLPEYGLAVRHGSRFVLPEDNEIIPLPDGSDLHMLPGRLPVGIDRRTSEFVVIASYEGRRLFAASAFVAPAYTALYHAAYRKEQGAVTLPLFAYSPLGFDGKRFVTTAVRVDMDTRQDARNFDQKEIIRRGRALLKRYPKNRLVAHLIHNCAFTYLCPAARNWVMGRWEAPIPTSVSCNSGCLGCISSQPAESRVPVTQPRLDFSPTVDEIIEYTVPHLMTAPRAVVSFGQGCEGEPLTRAGLIEEAVREMRRCTKRGTINLNTNASMPDRIERIIRAGLDSIRVSLNSAREEIYRAYYRPKGYGFSDVLESIGLAKKMGIWVSLNYLMFPGITDTKPEMDALKKILRKYPIDMIQMRNHNIDPDWYLKCLGFEFDAVRPVGILRWMEEIRRVRPSLRFGYFNPYLGNNGTRKKRKRL